MKMHARILRRSHSLLKVVILCEKKMHFFDENCRIHLGCHKKPIWIFFQIWKFTHNWDNTRNVSNFFFFLELWHITGIPQNIDPKLFPFGLWQKTGLSQKLFTDCFGFELQRCSTPRVSLIYCTTHVFWILAYLTTNNRDDFTGLMSTLTCNTQIKMEH